MDESLRIWRLICEVPAKWVPLACGIATALLLVLLHHVIGLLPNEMPELAWYTRDEATEVATLTASQLESRVSAGVAIAGLWSAALASIVLAVWATRATTERKKDRKQFLTSALLILAAVAGLGCVLNYFDLFFGRQVSTGLFQGVWLQNGWVVDDITSTGNVIVFTASVALGLAFVVILHTDDREPLQLFARRLDALRLMLYAGAAILAFGTLEVLALYRWPASSVVCDVQANAVRDMAATMAAGAGGAGSLILASLYIPTTLLMSSRARALAVNQGKLDTRTQNDWLAEQALLPNASQRIRELLAITAPLIAGSGIGQVTHRLFGGS